MTNARQLSLDLDKPHRNHYLFSDHYLEEILRRQPVWKVAMAASAEFLPWLRDLYAAERDQLEAYNESQLEDNWIRPILGRLGHVWETQPVIPGLDGNIKKPDYAFFPDEATRKAAVDAQRSEEYARSALAVGEAKAWTVNLSRKAAGAPVFDNNNPMFQIDYYLRASELPWGIVTNGRLWRLVHKDSSYRLDRYFEIDLQAALDTADEVQAQAVLAYFTLFFRRAAFERDATGRVLLNDVLSGSATYAVALENDLRDNAYKALEQIILGFFTPAANRLDPNDEADRAAVYRNSLLLLYRLLFLFYGESRGLLPMGNDEYRRRSVTALANAMSLDVENSREHPPMTREYWGRLRELFRIINGGDAALNEWLDVPRYNGGLFDPSRHPFLEDHFVGDAYLVRAIDYLARRRVSRDGQYAGRERVDYRTLGVRQLGSIYEGLLEYKVSVAKEEMVSVRSKSKEVWLPARERPKGNVIERKKPGELYLSTDKGERKATGSYYTPDYIVKYIVEQTLGPLVEAAKTKAEEGRDPAGQFERAILSLNVLDPAMGSGHFLVDATNYLARALATSELAGSQSVSDPAESDLTYWKRRVVEACIYGVDKNELAVELAKLSLWLETVAADKPLSFLDHHLRHGDSLIGARLADLAGPPTPARPEKKRPKDKGDAEQESLFDESAFTTGAGLAVAGAMTIEGMLTDDLDDVHAKERIWAEIRDTHLGRWRRLADLWVSAWFGNAMSAAEYRDLARRIQGVPGGLMSDEQAAAFLEHPAAVANDYFHWELEFPEVF
ncbi:MAG: BREX-1 system adenine-specific DNA-methyltransferase PglX, partial [Anaerolineae bacterium]|nr:BREX-1 system adenine-specific DNA-methyltransferase PglX [Anaerolineae bacterium]